MSGCGRSIGHVFTHEPVLRLTRASRAGGGVGGDGGRGGGGGTETEKVSSTRCAILVHAHTHELIAALITTNSAQQRKEPSARGGPAQNEAMIEVDKEMANTRNIQGIIFAGTRMHTRDGDWGGILGAHDFRN